MEDLTQDTEDPIAKFKRLRGDAPTEDPIEKFKRLQAEGQATEDPNRLLHESYKSGRLAKNVAEKNEADKVSLLGGAVDAAVEAPETFAAGFGAAPLISAGRYLRENAGNILKGKTENRPFGDVQAEVNRETSDIPYASAAGRVAGSIPLMGKARQLGDAAKALSGGSQLAANATMGATLGGAARLGANNSGEGVGDLLKGTIQDAALGAGMGVVAPAIANNTITRTLAGAGIGAAVAPEGYRTLGALGGGAAAFSPSATLGLGAKAAAKIGDAIPAIKALTDKAGSALTSLSEATGLRGAANKELAGIDDLQKMSGSMVGATGPAAEQKIADAARYKKLSDWFFNVAKGDTKTLTDPRVVSLMGDADLQPGMAAVSRIRAEAGNPLPKINVNGQDVEFLDPEGLHLLKRITQEGVDKSFMGERVLPEADALRIAPKLTALRNTLHELSPAYKRADNYYQLAAASKEAYDLGIGAAKPGMQNPSPTKTGVADVPGVENQIAQTTSADPVLARRLQAAVDRNARAGARAQIAQQVAAKGVEGGRAKVLTAPALAMSGPAAEQRAFAFGQNSPAFEKLLESTRASAINDTPRMINMPWKESAAARIFGFGHNPLESGRGATLLNRAVGDRAPAYQAILAAYKDGKISMQTLNDYLAMIAGRGTK